MPIAYEGGKPYIFVSYSHRDTGTVLKVIDHLQKAGYRIWFDGGIEAGSEWPEYIADHLQRCACVLTFVSGTFVESQNCRRELNFALDLKKELLNVYIEEVELTAGMRMQLGLSQAMFRSNFADEGSFLEALSRAKIIEKCRDVQESKKEKTAAPAVPKAEKPASPPAPKPKKSAEPKSAPKAKERDPRGKRIGWLCALLELSYGAVGPWLLHFLTGQNLGGFMLFALMLIPHIAIAVAVTQILKKSSGFMPADQRKSVFMVDLMCLAASSLVAVVWGVSMVRYPIAGVLKFLISLGVNVLPVIVAALIYFFSIGSAED